MAGTAKNPDITELSGEELDALIARAEEAIEFDLALSGEDVRLLLNAVMTLATMQERLSDKDITLHKLRKLLGMINASEKLGNLIKGAGSGGTKTTTPRKRKPNHTKPVKPKNIHHALEEQSKGDRCPACETGTLYKYEPAQLLRITGQTPFVPELHLSERLRCNACGQFFTAPLPEDVLADGDNNPKYGYSARTLMALQKYFAGAPFYRQESLQAMLGVSISASTIFDQCEHLANDLQPVFIALSALAANATHFHLDDTTHRVLAQGPVEKKKRGSEKMHTRTGLYASGLIARWDEHDIVLFQTNIGHAGEFIDELLDKRQPDKPPPILMSDALSSNTPTRLAVLHGVCNAHGRRQFVDVQNHFPEQVRWVLERYQHIWVNDDVCTEQAMAPEQRLAYHREHSLPVMQEIRAWGAQQIDEQDVEPNSGLGKAIGYFERHFDRLILFCKTEGAKLDNNVMEAALKIIVRNRKNAYFYKPPAGAAVSDVITSTIATTQLAQTNAFDYFNAIQRHRAAVKDNPEQWLPWNYTENPQMTALSN